MFQWWLCSSIISLHYLQTYGRCSNNLFGTDCKDVFCADIDVHFFTFKCLEIYFSLNNNILLQMSCFSHIICADCALTSGPHRCQICETHTRSHGKSLNSQTKLILFTKIKNKITNPCFHCYDRGTECKIEGCPRRDLE